MKYCRPGFNRLTSKGGDVKNAISVLIAAILLFVATATQAIEQQRTVNWCWASAVQEVLAQVNVRQSQTQVAARLDGWPQDRPAYIQELVLLLQSYGFQAWQAGRPGSPHELYGALVSGWKLIALVHPSNSDVGHYIVLQGIDPMSGGIIVSDPWTGATYMNSLPQLYLGWRWGDSVVVGIPM